MVYTPLHDPQDNDDLFMGFIFAKGGQFGFIFDGISVQWQEKGTYLSGDSY